MTDYPPSSVIHEPGDWNSDRVDGCYLVETISADQASGIQIFVVWGYGAFIKAGDYLAGNFHQLLGDRFYEVVEVDYPARRVPDRFRAVLRATSIQIVQEGS